MTARLTRYNYNLLDVIIIVNESGQYIKIIWKSGMAFPSEDLWSDIIECSICTKVMSDPRALPCLHTFCLKCIEKHGKRQSHQDNGINRNCPLCRQLFTVSGRKYSNLPRNFYIAKLLEARKEMLRESKKKDNKKASVNNIKLTLGKKYRMRSVS